MGVGLKKSANTASKTSISTIAAPTMDALLRLNRRQISCKLLSPAPSSATRSSSRPVSSNCRSSIMRVTLLAVTDSGVENGQEDVRQQIADQDQCAVDQ